MDVQAAVRDFKAMTDRVPELVEAARASTARYARDEIEETELFLWWLLDGNYVFLGARDYVLEGGMLSVAPGRGLGILAGDEGSAYASPVRLEAIDPGLRERLVEGNLLVVSKTNRFATVHRRVKMDDITVKRVGPDGTTVGALRLVGLFTGKAYMAPASRIPILSRKLRQIAVAEDFLEGSHDYKALVELFESFPKDELFVASAEDLREQLVSLLDLQERQQTQLFIRPDIEERRVAVLVALPRDRFNAELRLRLQELFLERFQGSSIDYHLSLGEEEQARIHFTVHVDGEIPEVSLHGPGAGGDRPRADLGRPAARAPRVRLRRGTGIRARREVHAALPRLLQVVDGRVPGRPRRRGSSSVSRRVKHSSSRFRTSATMIRT